MAVARRLLPLLLMLAWLGPAEARDGGRGNLAEPVDRALGRLQSPLARDREQGIEDLVALLPGARKRIIEALPRASWDVRASLVQVLAQDASDEAVRALLDVLSDADDAQSAAVFLKIAADPPTSKRLLETVRTDRARFGDGGKARMRRLDELHGLLLRAEVEDLFVGRKSRTGSTGYYRGQYDLLKYARKEALEVVLHIAMDKAMRVPGVYQTGPYRFLRPKPIDFWELRDMATNAIGELATPADERVLLKLEIYTQELRRRVAAEHQRLGEIRFSLPREEYEELQEDFGIELGRYGDLLTAAYLVKRDDDAQWTIRKFLYLIDRGGGYWENLRFGRSTARSIRATTLIRAGWYEEAVAVYRQLLSDSFSSTSTAYYNIACAYASWSLDPKLSKEEQAYKRKLALDNLDAAVDEGWTDLGWMDEDGDLNPIRDTRRYRSIVERIRRLLGIK